ncbi:isopeptide-forming domain-containing fimbrial protein, partial [Saccharophagus sp. K07]|uniref:isopeptide-forming domain-containing fimbrial protein n=1 Tax=Saccharophagus sp. K07 TaxID=2283636 RepID=UPI0016527AF9|nr:isopeptide-forming domain-containing fimbrial protein [Saccharophagus sp. K07]
MSGSLAALVTVRGRRAWLLLCALLVLVFAATPAVAQQVVVNTATVSPPDGVVDPDTDNNEATDETPIVQVATSKSSSPASGEAVSVGQTITYTLAVEVSGGPLPADVVLTDTISPGQTLDAGSLPSGCSSSPGGGGETIVTCTVPANSAAGTYTFKYSTTVDVGATDSVSNSVEPNVGTCDDCKTDHPLAPPAVTYNKTATLPAGQTAVSVGDVITYTLTATVSESQLTSALVLTDTLGTGLTFGAVGTQTSTDPANATPFTCTGSLSCTLPAGTVPGTYTVSYTATVNDQAVGQVRNAVVGNQGTCEVDCDIDVPVADPSVTYNKTATLPAGQTAVSVGDVITYTLTATVSESQLTSALVLTDTLGTGLTFGAVGTQTSTDPANATPFTCTGSLSCTLPAGTVPGTYTVSYTATVNDQAVGQVRNAVVGNQGTCEVDCDIDVPVADPSVTYNKTATLPAGQTAVSVGDVITYTLTATVSESQLTSALVLTDTLGTGLTFGAVGTQTSTDPANATPFTCTGSLSCTLPAGTVPGTYTVSYTATVNDQATGTVSNAVLGDQGTCDADCDVDVPVTDPSVTYNKSADTAGPVSVGDVITYTLTATVTNSQLVTDLVLTDTLGVGLTFGSVTNAGAFTCTGSLSCTLPAGTVPGTYTVSYTATVNDQAVGQVRNAVVG